MGLSERVNCILLVDSGSTLWGSGGKVEAMEDVELGPQKIVALWIPGLYFGAEERSN